MSARQLGREIQRCFRDAGIDVVTGNDLERVHAATADGGVTTIEEGVIVETTVDGEDRRFTADELFVATGVQPNSENIGLGTVGIDTDDHGAVVVDGHFRTTNPDVYAAGDVIGESELETVAAKEGNHAVKNAFGNEEETIDYNAVPNVVFTSPEVATARRRGPSRILVGYFRSSSTTRQTRSSASTWSDRAPPT